MIRRFALCLALSAPMTAGAQQADLILTNARLWTGDSARPSAEAVAILGERILAVGSRADVMAARGPKTVVRDLGGKFVSPGFIDNHTHFAQAGALLTGVNLLDVADPLRLVRRVREARDRLPRGAWIVGGEWGAYEAWAQGSTGSATASAAAPARPFTPHRSLIDSLTPATPVLLSRWDRSSYLAKRSRTRGRGGGVFLGGCGM